MSLLDSFRKGFRFFLMSMGVSTYPRKAAQMTDAPKSPAAPPVKPE
jgi:hypothetical protein